MALALRSTFVVAGSLAALLASPGCIDIVGADLHNKFVEREEKRFSTGATPDVTLTTFDGSIEIRAWDKPEVEVIIEKRAVSKEAAALIEVHADQQGNKVTLEVKTQKNSGFIHFNNSRSAKLIVSAPAGSNVAARSGDGSIDIERITGQLELRTGDGSIRGRSLSGDVRAHTGDGSIKLEGVTGALDVETGDGGVAVSGKMTRVRARTGDGSVTIHASPGSVAQGDWEIVTGDGSVTLEVPDGFNAEIDAHTGDGGIHLNDVAVSNVTGKIGRNDVRGRLGSGGANVRLRTGDGSISLRRALSAEASGT
jgi:DUF4097 and DUF4098 domain-containing protein YvlB